MTTSRYRKSALKKVRYQIAGAVGLVPVAVGMALPATAQAATNVKAQSSTGKTVRHPLAKTAHHPLAHPMGLISGCTTSNRATLPAMPAHNLLGGQFFYALTPDVCVGTIEGKFQWNKSFSKSVDGEFIWFNGGNIGVHTRESARSVFEGVGSHTLDFGDHHGFTPATSGSGCITSQFAGGNFACTPVPI